MLKQPSPAAKMREFLVGLGEQKILFLIDEYDHFANSVLADDLQLFQKVMGKGGFVRSFYETIKTATMTGTVDRLFITGVTPLMLDSMTSGFNIGENISLHEDFNSAVGFTQDEVASLLQPLVGSCQLDADALLVDVRRWYNGYRFYAQAPETVYNPNMLLYFLKNFRIKDCSYPKQMLDENIASDYGKIMGMFSIGNRDTNFVVLDEIITTGEVGAIHRRKFDFDKGFDRALLLAVEALALHDDVQPLATEVQRVLQLFSSRGFTNMDEKHVKTLALTLLYQSPVYFIQSEREMGHKYPDILLMERSPFAVKHQYLIELKYAKKGDKEKGWEAKRKEGIEQVQGYLQLPEIAALPKLSAWVLLTDGERVTVIKVEGSVDRSTTF